MQNICKEIKAINKFPNFLYKVKAIVSSKSTMSQK